MHDVTQLTLFGDIPTCQGPGCDRPVLKWVVKGARVPEYCSKSCLRRSFRTRHAERLSAERKPRERERYATDPEFRATRLRREAERYRREGERLRARGKAWRESNAELIRERARAAYAASPEAKREAAARWNRENPDAAKAIRRRRRALKLAAEAFSVLPRDLRRMEHRQRGCCVYCGQRRPLTLEHLIPLSRGGRDAIGNYALACKSCNSSKNNLLVMEYRLNRPRIRRRAG